MYLVFVTCICFPVNFKKYLRNLFYRTPLGDCFCILTHDVLILNPPKMSSGKADLDVLEIIKNFKRMSEM